MAYMDTAYNSYGRYEVLVDLIRRVVRAHRIPGRPALSRHRRRHAHTGEMGMSSAMPRYTYGRYEVLVDLVRRVVRAHRIRGRPLRPLRPRPQVRAGLRHKKNIVMAAAT